MDKRSLPPTPPEPAPRQPKPAPKQSVEGSVKDTIEAILVAFMLAFIFRAFIVEAFVIPTGSMAPTLLGEHIRITCDKCGYHFKADTPAANHASSGDPRIDRQYPVLDRRINAEHDRQYACPMCQHLNRAPGGTYVSSGDRILVHKYLYSINEPKRFDVVVFKAPHVPQTNYIKRLIGLENQETMLLDGNCYYNATPNNEAGWRIARKTDPNENPHAEKIQRAVFQPIYHSQYVPLDYDVTSSSNRWLVPWVVSGDAGTDAAAWKRGNGANDPELDPRGGYVFDSTGKGTLRFAFDRVFTDDHHAGLVPYGQGKRSGIIETLAHPTSDFPIEDVRIAVAVQAKQQGLSLTLRSSARLDDKNGVTHLIAAGIDAQGNATISRGDQPQPLASANIGPFDPGVTRIVEFWYVDQEASLWVDGKRILVKQFDDISYAELRKRAAPFQQFASAGLEKEHKNQTDKRLGMHTPVVKIEVAGSPVTFHHVELDRDLFWLHAGKGTVGGNQADTPVTLRANEFFCLGDNSPYSSDSRLWDEVDPWVLKRTIAEGTSEREGLGIVPRRLIMGKAFFVYFPTMIGSSPQSSPMFPNFGEMRFIH